MFHIFCDFSDCGEKHQKGIKERIRKVNWINCSTHSYLKVGTIPVSGVGSSCCAPSVPRSTRMVPGAPARSPCGSFVNRFCEYLMKTTINFQSIFDKISKHFVYQSCGGFMQSRSILTRFWNFQWNSKTFVHPFGEHFTQPRAILTRFLGRLD